MILHLVSFFGPFSPISMKRSIATIAEYLLDEYTTSLV